MIISIIVAIGKNNEIGKNNKLLWHLGDDLKRFKKLTLNKIVIMGQKTYESLPIKPLPKRTNIIITDNKNLSFDKCIMAFSIDDAIKKAENLKYNDEIFIIGGGSIYKQFFNISDYLYITHVNESFNADVFFPEIKEKDWKFISQEIHSKDENNEYDYSYVKYKKIK